MKRRRIPQESSSIVGREPWSPENHLQVTGVSWGRKKNLDEGVREPPYIPRNLTRRIYPMGDQIYPIWLDMSGLDPDISGGLGLSEILQKIGPGRIYLSWDIYI
jgi:hypothetical protein